MLHALILFARARRGGVVQDGVLRAGSVLAGFAVLISVIGIAPTRLPGTKGARNGVMLLAAVLVAATMASAVLTG